MQKACYLIFTLIFFPQELLAVPWIAKESTDTIINQIAIEIITTCYQNPTTIIIDGDADGSIVRSLWHDQSIATIVLSASSKTNLSGDQPSILHLFLVTADSTEELGTKLLTIKHTPWWNIMGEFIVLDRSGKNCDNARDTLKTAWTRNIVTAFFFCYDALLQSFNVYTFNPFTNRATEGWLEVKNTEEHGWTLYRRQYQKGNMCENWSFDRTKYLDGYKIRIVVSKPQSDKWFPQRDYHPSLSNWKPDHEYDKGVFDLIPKLDGRVAKVIQSGLNTTVGLHFDSQKYYTPEPEGFFKRLLNSSSDFAVCIATYQTIYNFTPIYPIMWSGVAIVTQHRGYYTPVEKIMNFYGHWIPIVTVLILSVVFIAEILVEKKNKIVFATFEILRLLVNTALHIKMKTFPVRIFFFGIFLYFLILHATFSGNLSAFLTKLERRKNVERVEDLKDPRYSVVYIIKSGRRLIVDPELELKVQVPAWPFCVPQVIANKSIACLGDTGVMKKAAAEYDIHLADKEVGPNAYIYPVRFDWPLTDRINMLFIRLAQSGVSKMWGLDMWANANIKLKTLAAKSVPHARPISASMLVFAFVILGFGLSCSVVSFCIEVAIKYEFFRIQKINFANNITWKN